MRTLRQFTATKYQQIIDYTAGMLKKASRRVFTPSGALLKAWGSVLIAKRAELSHLELIRKAIMDFLAAVKRYYHVRQVVIYALCTLNFTLAYLLYADEVQAFFEANTVDFQEERIVEGVGVIEEISLQEVGVIGELEILMDPRVQNIERILKKNNSPMVGLEWYIVDTADAFGVDPYLIVAIAGQESSFGKHSCGFNAWGYANCKVRFLSWQDGIARVAELLSKAPYYVQETTTVQKLYAVGSIYAEDPNWPNRVSSFYNQIALAK